MVLKKIFFLLFFCILLINKSAITSQILDYETENFIKIIIDEISNVNKINKKIKFKILSDNKINAFVDQNNVIYITSALIEYSPDYVALTSVIAHEIGHIDKNHVAERISSSNKLSRFKNISNLSIVAGSLITSNPQVLQGVALSSAGTSNLFLNFSKNQEIEADIYSIETLKKLNINSNSIIDLLKIIEKKAMEKGLTKDKQRYSTHPYFEDRIKLINFLNVNEKQSFNRKLNDQFMFIKAKFLGYSSNVNVINKLKDPYRSYSESIHYAKEGRLNDSLKKINYLISKNKDNISLIETKADILFSHGYTKEAIDFYKIVVNNYPNNHYAQISIFANNDIQDKTKAEVEIIFFKNINLLKKYYNNTNIILQFIKIAENINQKEWVEFLNFWLNNQSNDKNYLNQGFEKYRKSNDKDLRELIKIITYNMI